MCLPGLAWPLRSWLQDRYCTMLQGILLWLPQIIFTIQDQFAQNFAALVQVSINPEK